MMMPTRHLEEQKASPGERLLWLMEQYSRYEGTLNVPIVVFVEGRLDPQVLREALATLAIRHQSLRTTFHYSLRVLRRRIHEYLVPTLEVTDTLLPSKQLRSSVELAEVARRQLDVAENCVAATLLRCPEGKDVLVLVIHHLVTDAWSNRILARDLGEFYGAARDGVPPNLPLAPASASADMAAMAGIHFQQGVEYWRSHLDGAAFIELRPIAPQQRSAAVLHRALEPSLQRAVHAFSRESHASLFIVLLSAFFLALSTRTGQRDFAIGSLFANRTDRQSWDAVGYFVSLLALRVRITDDDDHLALVEQIRDVVGDALGYQDVPFHLLPGTVTTMRGQVHSVVFHMLATPPGVRLDSFGGQSATIDFELALLSSRFDLELVIVPSPNELQLIFRYVPEACAEIDIKRLADSYVEMLERFTTAHLRRTDTNAQASSPTR